jgi:uncharacterized protein YjbJ (UPF0337 family)
MGASDKVTGRAKQKLGELADSEATRREGLQKERAADKKEEAARAQTAAEEKQAEAERLEKQT